MVGQSEAVISSYWFALRALYRGQIYRPTLTSFIISDLYILIKIYSIRFILFTDVGGDALSMEHLESRFFVSV
jgi:hypothetical protein